MNMKKSIIFFAVIAAVVFLAALEIATVGLPEVNYPILSICGICLCAGLVYMRLSLYKPMQLLWCFLGGVALTMFVVFGSHFAQCLPFAIDYFHLGALTSLLLLIFTALFVTMVYGYSLYLFVFYFCDMKSKIKDF